MTAFEKAIANGDNAELAALIDRRLGGDQLDLPLDSLGVDCPRSAIVDLHRSRDKRKAIEAAIDQLVDSVVSERIEAVRKCSTCDETVLWLLEFFALLHETRYVKPLGRLKETCSYLMVLDPKSEPVRVVQLAAFKVMSSSGQFQASLAQLAAPALMSIEAAGDFARMAAEFAPSSFLHDLAPLLLTRYLERDPSELGFLTDSLDIAITSLLSQGKAPLDEGLGHFLWCAARTKPAVREAVAETLSRSPLPISVLRKFEQDYWDVFPPVDLQFRDFEQERAALRREFAERVVFPEGASLSIATNPLPYAEAAYFYLFSMIMSIVHDIDINIHTMGYGGVLSKLHAKKIHLAAHNQFIKNQPIGGNEDSSLVWTEPLVRFCGYDILASGELLEARIRERGLTAAATALACEMLEGHFLDDAATKPPPEPLAELVRSVRLTYLSDTDTEVAGQSFFGMQDPRFIDSLDPDEGLERLLDAEVGFYVGGALQSHYAKTVCPSRVIRVAEVAQETTVHFFALQKTYREHKTLFDHLAADWRLVDQVWHWLEDPVHAPKALRPLLIEMQNGLVLLINRDRSLKNGFATSFRELDDLLRRHDTLLRPKGVFEPYKIEFQEAEAGPEDNIADPDLRRPPSQSDKVVEFPRQGASTKGHKP